MTIDMSNETACNKPKFSVFLISITQNIAMVKAFYPNYKTAMFIQFTGKAPPVHTFPI